MKQGITRHDNYCPLFPKTENGRPGQGSPAFILNINKTLLLRM